MGFGHSLFLVKEGDAKAASAPVWEPPCDRDEAAPTGKHARLAACWGGLSGILSRPCDRNEATATGRWD